MRATEDGDEDIIGCLPRVICTSHRVRDNSVSSLPKSVKSGKEDFLDNEFDRYACFLNIYQEQPNPPDVISSLLRTLESYITLSSLGSSDKTLNKLSVTSLHYISHLTKVRGYKVIVRLLPHHVAYLDKLLTALEQYQNSVGSHLFERHMLLLWLWIVCKNPFDFRRFDLVDQPGSTLSRILAVATSYSKYPWATTHPAAVLVITQCLARCLLLIALLTTADYFAVGNRWRCYTKVCAEIYHWDEVVREQAAIALSILAPLHPHYLSARLGKLLAGCNTSNPVHRHGYLLALSHFLQGFLSARYTCDKELLRQAISLPCKLKAESEKLKVSGGELTLLALSAFIRCLSSVPLQLNANESKRANSGRLRTLQRGGNDEVGIASKEELYGRKSQICQGNWIMLVVVANTVGRRNGKTELSSTMVNRMSEAAQSEANTVYLRKMKMMTRFSLAQQM